MLGKKLHHQTHRHYRAALFHICSKCAVKPDQKGIVITVITTSPVSKGPADKGRQAQKIIEQMKELDWKCHHHYASPWKELEFIGNAIGAQQHRRKLRDQEVADPIGPTAVGFSGPVGRH